MTRRACGNACIAFTRLLPGMAVTFALVAIVSADNGIVRVSVDSDGQEAERGASQRSVSAAGRFALFASEDEDLVDDDTNRLLDIFVHDVVHGTTRRANLSWEGREANEITSLGRLSRNGRFVVFSSAATNLIPNDENGRVPDVFLRDRTTETTTVISVSSDGEQGDRGSGLARMSANTRFIVFRSGARNLVPDDRNDRGDVFVRDRWASLTTRISVNSAGEEANDHSGGNGLAMTPDGRFVAFSSDADNLVEDDDNLVRDIFVHDRDFDEDGIFDEPGAIETVRVSVGNGWESEDSSFSASISADGRFIAFDSVGRIVGPDFNKTCDIFIHDREEHFTRIVTMGIGGRAGNGPSFTPSISADGSMITFVSLASDLVPGDNNQTTDIFIYHVARRTIERVVMGRKGEETNACSSEPSFAAGGCFIGFSSSATNLVEGDTNGAADAFLLQLCIPGDFDGDERVDQGDFEILESCLTGPGVRPVEECKKADLDVDLDVDIYDFTILQSYYTGS